MIRLLCLISSVALPIAFGADLRFSTLNVANEVSLGDDIMVHWDSGSLEGSNSLDWIGLYTKGSCEQNKVQTAPVAGSTTDVSMITQLGQNRCYLQAQSLPHKERSGTVIFNYQDLKFTAGEYEARYFQGDSSHGQGMVCRQMEDSAGYNYCAYEASSVSATITVTGGLSFQPVNTQEAIDLGCVRVNY